MTNEDSDLRFEDEAREEIESLKKAILGEIISMMREAKKEVTPESLTLIVASTIGLRMILQPEFRGTAVRMLAMLVVDQVLTAVEKEDAGDSAPTA